MVLRIGTRKSRLAMVQTEIVRDAILKRFPDMEIELVPMSTRGDKLLDRSLTSFGGKGVFTKELEEALLRGEIDLAVHSAKDMPMEFPDGLCLGAVLEREAPWDVLVTRSGTPARELAAGSMIGTSSLRRQIQICAENPKVQVKLLRGNVQTRLEKLRMGQYDGILLAEAGLRRLGLSKAEGLHMEVMDAESFVPAAGQGILALEVRKGELSEVMEAIHSPETAAELYAERRFLTLLGGSCNAPCGAWCRLEGEQLIMRVMYARDGRHPAYASGRQDISGPRLLDGRKLEMDRKQREDYLMTQAGELAKRMAIQVSVQPVYLVGAGPGDAGLLTRRGLECIRKADVIVYDNLISGSVLNEARLDAELIYAGKRAGRHAMSQEEICALLVELAESGRRVVRLKGGDPFLFGRGGEEAIALAKRGIPCQVVSGVSSAYSVPASAGIPVTHRGVASSLHIITGHEGTGKKECIDYGILAKEEGTLVFLMGLSRLEEITARLMESGKDGHVPAAVISQGTTARQQSVYSDLAHIAGEVRSRQLQTPAILVVGEAAAFGERTRLGLGGPLKGKRVLVTGTRTMVRELVQELEPLGAETVAVSLIESRICRTEEVRQALSQLERYQWLVFTSGNGVDLFFEAMREANIDLRRLMKLKFAVIGRKTAEALKRHGLISDFVPEQFSGADLAREWIPTLGSEERVMLMRAKEGSLVLPQKLAQAGIPFADIPLYETWVDRRRGEELNRQVKEADYVVVASGSAARAMAEMLEDTADLNGKLVSIGPTTTREATRLGLPVYADAVEYTAEGIVAVILADVQMNGDRAVQSALEPETLLVDSGASGKEAECEAYFPIFISLQKKIVLVAGAGPVAARRAAVLSEFGARVVVVAPEGCQMMEHLEKSGAVHWERRSFLPSDLNGVSLAVAATNDGAVNRQIVKLGQEAGILVNHAGDQKQCDFYFPGIARNGSLVAGVTASGTDHKKAAEVTRRLKEWIENQGKEETNETGHDIKHGSGGAGSISGGSEAVF